MKARSYSLFRRRRDLKSGRWEKIGGLIGPKASIVRFYQSALIANALRELDPDYEYQIRPVTQ